MQSPAFEKQGIGNFISYFSMKTLRKLSSVLTGLLFNLQGKNKEPSLLKCILILLLFESI